MTLKAVISDLDGVIVDTVPIHFKAWKKMFGEYGKEFTFEDYKEKVDGIPRVDGARAILTDLTEEEVKKACDIKQSYFLEVIKAGDVPAYDSTRKLFETLKNKGIKVAVISSSKNCPYILEKINMYPIIDAEVSGNDITIGKPDPQIFLMAAEKIGVDPSECVVFEDAVLGVLSAKNAGMKCVGIDRHNDPERLGKADMIINDLSEVNYERLLKELFE